MLFSGFSTICNKKSGKSYCSYHFLVSKMRLELTRTIVHYPLKVARLPIPPPGHCCERKTGLEPATPTLARSCSTN